MFLGADGVSDVTSHEHSGVYANVIISHLEYDLQQPRGK